MPFELDKELKEFIDGYINSFIHWDLIAFFARNPGTRDDAAGIARRLGRREEDMAPILEDLAKKGVLDPDKRTKKVIYFYSPNPQLKKRIDNFVKALDSKINRMMILTEFLQKKGGRIA